MTGRLVIDGAAVAVSLFNTMLLLWLGLTVLLNSDRRAWGIWLGGGGLLLGAAFFVSHTAILSLGLISLGWNTVFWWTVGLVPAIALPFAWYVVVLWYAGFWEAPASALRRRQGRWFQLTVSLLGLGLLGLGLGVFLLATPWSRFTALRLIIRYSIAGIPLLALGYAAYVVLCTGLSLDALRRPGPARRVMGEMARQRARPWFTAVSVLLLCVSLLVTGTLGWLVQVAQQQSFNDIFRHAALTIGLLDLLIAGCIGLAVILLGQAVVSYEVFTGKTLPRQGLGRQWRRTLALAAGYGGVVWGSILLDLRPVYNLLLTAILIACFFALFSWRAYRERELLISRLRPFVSSQRLYDRLLGPGEPVTADADAPLRALCVDVLDAGRGVLVPLGPLAPLVGPPLVFPPGASSPAPDVVAQLGRQLQDGQEPLPLDPQRHAGLIWAVPLWSERGLIGAFLLGPKRGGGLYTQEEMDIARLSGERLIDTRASAEMARRLMALQRQRLAHSQVVDQQTRRVLHDDVLPTLQTAIIALGGREAEPVVEAVAGLTAAHRRIADLLREMPTARAPEVARLGLVGALQATVAEEFAPAFDQVEWRIAPAAAAELAQLPALVAEVLFYAAREAIRNAARYGRGERSPEWPLRLMLSAPEQGRPRLVIEDNGVGLNNGAAGGGGQGLALHGTMMAVIGGELATESVPGQFTRVTLTLPALDQVFAGALPGH